MIFSFLHNFSQYIKLNDSIILAVSGGVDSMVLLDFVRTVHPKDNIIVAHFDHSLRGAESDGDRELVAQECKNMDIIFECKKMDIGRLATEENMNLEAIARRERYAFLEEIRDQYNAKYIITAHHADDQVETILMNMIKGGKVQGLSGMPILSQHILRPLLPFSKKAILEHAEHAGIVFREDSSNADTKYDRNKIRQKILPVLEEINPSIHKTIEKLAKYMQELTEYFDVASRDWLISAAKNSGKKHSFLIAEFEATHSFFQKEIIAELYRRAHAGSSQGLSTKLITELIRFISDKGSYGKKEIKKLHMERKGERIFY